MTVDDTEFVTVDDTVDDTEFVNVDDTEVRIISFLKLMNMSAIINAG